MYDPEYYEDGINVDEAVLTELVVEAVSAGVQPDTISKLGDVFPDSSAELARAIRQEIEYARENGTWATLQQSQSVPQRDADTASERQAENETAIPGFDGAETRTQEQKDAGLRSFLGDDLYGEMYGQAESTPSQAPSDFSLSTQTEASLQGQAAQQEQARLADEEQSRQQEARAAADQERDSFTLSGSDSLVDQAEARGQSNIFDQPATDIDARANEAATSATSVGPAPSEAQIEAGNYKKGHVRVQGLDISVENPRGSTRSGTDPDGNTWSREMSDHYGYIRRTEGADGEHVDVFVGPNPESNRIFVVDQVNQDGSFDEHKVLMGFNNRQEAIDAYKANYDEGWKVGPVTPMPVDRFKQWLDSGDTTKPLSNKTFPDPAARSERKSESAPTKDVEQMRSIAARNQMLNEASPEAIASFQRMFDDPDTPTVRRVRRFSWTSFTLQCLSSDDTRRDSSRPETS